MIDARISDISRQRAVYELLSAWHMTPDGWREHFSQSEIEESLEASYTLLLGMIDDVTHATEADYQLLRNWSHKEIMSDAPQALIEEMLVHS